ncbi:MAG: hypothetical protein ACYC61_08565 [Isosphaeraceae bacterium]
MVPIGQPYRPAGSLDVRSMLITVILGVTAAVIGAAVVWLWERSPIPTFVVITHLVQGMFVGGVMAFAVGRLRMRTPLLIAVVGFACGWLSVFFVHYGHYVSMVTSAASELRVQVVQDPTIPEARRKEILDQLDTDPASVVDKLLAMRTGHSGFIGSLFLRNEQGFTIKGRHETGTFVWVLWGFEALIAALVAASVPGAIASRAYCEDCGYWCDKPTDRITMPAAASEAMLQALREDHPARVAELLSNPPPLDESGFLDIALHNCPGCDLCFANATRRFAKKKETKVVLVMRMHRISPEAAAALRGPMIAGDAADQVESEGQEDDPLDPDECPERVAGDGHGEHGQAGASA